MERYLEILYCPRNMFSKRNSALSALLAVGVVTMLSLYQDRVIKTERPRAITPKTIIEKQAAVQTTKTAPATKKRVKSTAEEEEKRIRKIFAEILSAEALASEEARQADPTYGKRFAAVVKTRYALYKQAICLKHDLTSDQLTEIISKVSDLPRR